MSMKRALQIILGIGFAGLCFSGYLTFQEFYAEPGTAACTPVGQPGTMFGYPPCVYGFVMYLAVVVVAALGLYTPRHPRKSRSDVSHDEVQRGGHLSSV